jgi:hypothetical protein
LSAPRRASRRPADAALTSATRRYAFDEEDNESNIVFADSQDGVEQIKCATLNKLIERMTKEGKHDLNVSARPRGRGAPRALTPARRRRRCATPSC